MVRERVFTEVAVAGAPGVCFCVDGPAGDPLARRLLERERIDEPVQRMLVGLVEPGMRVLDLGCQLGIFSLPAAVLGAEVMAVDASPRHVELLRAAAERNGFERLEVAQAALAPAGPPRTDVPATTVDALMERRKWDTVDLVRMDMDGGEPAALWGMERLFATGCRPLIVLACNGGTLPWFGSSVPELRHQLTELGYQLFLIDHLRPGVLVEAAADTLQPECVSDCLAASSLPDSTASSLPDSISDQWRIEPPLGREALITRLLDTAASERSADRAYAAHLMADGPHWLRAAGETDAARRALAQDVDPDVRDAVAPDHEPSWAVESMLAPEPTFRGRPIDIRVWVEGVSLRRSSGGLEPLHAPSPPPPDELLVTDAWLHVRSGQLVGVLADEQAAGSAFLRLLAGAEEPIVGQLELEGPATALVPVCAGLELGLSVAENIMVMGEVLGLAGSTVADGIDRVAELAGLERPSAVTLEGLPALTGATLALATALSMAEPKLLLLDAIPGRLPSPFAEWARARVSALQSAGAAVVQSVTDAEHLLGTPDRIVWIAAGRVQASGHPASVFEAYARHRLGLSERPLDRRPSLAMRVPR